jgi:DNA polymerase-3 subunit beta
MTFTVNRKQLETELSLLSTVAERKSTIPVLSYTKFSLSGSTLTLTATNMDTSLITSLPASGDEWQGCVPSKQLYELVRLFNGEEIQFVPEEGRVVVKLGKSRHKLPTYEAAQFPTIEQPQVEMTAIDGPILSKALQRALRCITTDASEYWMQGVSLRSIDGQLYVVASNSRQTAICAIESPLQVDVLIPHRAIAALVKLISEGEVSVGIGENQIIFQQSGRTFTARLLDAKFPEWRPLIPTSYKYSITLDSETARQAFRLAAVTAYETALIPVPLRLTLGHDEMIIETRESERGHSSETVAAPCAALNGSELEIGINGAHFIGFLDDAEKAVLSFNDNPGPLQLSSEGEPGYRYITMALKV